MNHNLLATDQYKVVSRSSFQDFHFETLTQLYQPFIGTASVSLYTTLVSQLETGNFQQITATQHEQLLITLGINLSEFIDAIKRLEAVALLKSYRKLDDTLMVYELLPAKDGQSFFNDELLSSMLLQYVGDQRFALLVEKFEGNHWSKNEFKELTHSFADVFEKQNLKTSESSLRVSQNDSKKIVIPEKLDYQFMKKILQNSFVNVQDVTKNLETINTIAMMYGLDEMQVVKLIEESFDVAHDRVNWLAFRKLASQKYEFILKNPSMHSDSRGNENKTVEADNFNGNEEKILFQAFQEYAPMEFLSALKEEQGMPSISNEERITISKAVSDGGLPLAVINVLIHYMLVDQQMSSINQKYFEKTALDWMKQKIKTPQQAINYILKRQAGMRKKSTKFQSKGRKPIVEKLPDWAKKQSNEEKSQNISNSEEINQDIKRLMKKINDDH